MAFHVSEPNSYLAITGAGIENVRIVKKGFVYPFQKVTKLSMLILPEKHALRDWMC